MLFPCVYLSHLLHFSMTCYVAKELLLCLNCVSFDKNKVWRKKNDTVVKRTNGRTNNWTIIVICTFYNIYVHTEYKDSIYHPSVRLWCSLSKQSCHKTLDRSHGGADCLPTPQYYFASQAFWCLKKRKEKKNNQGRQQLCPESGTADPLKSFSTLDCHV